jgi:hypothetical protein
VCVTYVGPGLVVLLILAIVVVSVIVAMGDLSNEGLPTGGGSSKKG